MVNFGLLADQIVLEVWGTPVTFNGFRVLAALLRCSQVVSVSQTLRVEQRAPPMFGRATIRLGIGPHSSVKLLYTCYRPIANEQASCIVSPKTSIFLVCEELGQKLTNFNNFGITVHTHTHTDRLLYLDH